MEWFKHVTDSHDDPDVSDAWDKFGDAGYTIFFVLLEIYGREFNTVDSDGWLTLSQSFFRRKLRKNWKTIQKVLIFYEKRKRIFHKIDDERLSIKVPKFLSIASNWTKRTKAEAVKPTEGTTEGTTEPPPAIRNEEIEKEEIENKAPIVPQGDGKEIPVKPKLIPLKNKRLSKTEKRRLRVTENTALMARMGVWFNRRASTLWTIEEAAALEQVGEIEEIDLEVLEAFYTYAGTLPCYPRHDVITLLNNWQGEIDKANRFKQERNNVKKGNGPGNRTRSEGLNDPNDYAGYGE